MKKVAFLTSFNTDLLKRDCEKCAAEKFGGRMELWWHGYGQYVQSVADEKSTFYSFKPDIVVIHFEIETLIGDKFYDSLSIGSGEWGALLNSAKSSIKNLAELITSRLPECRIVCENFIQRENPFTGILDINSEFGNNPVTAEMNLFLASLVKEFKGKFFINDYASLIASEGKSAWFDSRMMRLAKQPFNYSRFSDLAHHYLSAADLLLSPRKKCIVADLDNTLWGGIIGQDGFDNIQLGNSGAGEAYVRFQKLLLNFYRQGMFIALCSKNNYEDAMEVIEKHPDMLLKKEYFAAVRINWQDKALNIKEIAAELNIGTDSLVFVDDNPAECELVKQQIPDVEVINLKGDPDNYISQLLNLTSLQAFSLTSEDLNRNTMHHQDIQRKEFETSFTNLDDYYKSLQMKGFLSLNSQSAVSRIAQLTQKTNQFTLTTRRYSTEEIKSFINSGGCRIYTLRLEDKFGDNGIIAAAIVKCGETKWHIDTFLMSCRVIGRQAENLLLQSIFDDALKAGVNVVTAEFIPTKKNMPAQKFLPDSGFYSAGDGEYEIALPAGKLNYFIELIRE